MLAKALKFVVSSSVFLALNGSLVVLFAIFLYGDKVSLSILFAAFLATFSVYSLNKVTDIKEDFLNKSESESKLAPYYLVPSIVAMIASLAIGATLGLLALLILVAPLIFGFVYSVRLAKSLPRLKEVMGVKSLIVAFSWAITGALLPESVQSIVTDKVILVFFYIFFQLLVNTIIFDALDISGDYLSGVKTIPITLGKTKTRTLLLGINTCLVLWLIYCFFAGQFLGYMPGLAFGVAYTYIIIWHFLGKSGNRLRAQVIIDGEWVPIVILLKAILR